MKLIRAARIAGGTSLAAGIYSLLVLRPFYLHAAQLPQTQRPAEESL